MKLANGICAGVFVKEYAVYKTWINLRYNPKGHRLQQQYKNFMAPGSHKINDCLLNSFKVSCHRDYFLMVKISLGLLVSKWATASSTLNTWHVRLPSLLSVAFSF